MKRFMMLLSLIAALTLTSHAFATETNAVKDSLLRILDTRPANESHLDALYSLALLDPMSPSGLQYLDTLTEASIAQDNKKYQCYAAYAHLVYYFNHQDEANTVLWMTKLSPIALELKNYNLYFSGKRAEITMRIIKRKVESSINEAEEMYKLAEKLKYAQGMSSAKLCLMTAYFMTARYKEGLDAAQDAYHRLPEDASLEVRKDVLQEISLSCASIKHPSLLRYLHEYDAVLTKLTQEENNPRAYTGSRLLLESLYADYYLKADDMNQALAHLKEMDKYFSPTSFIPSRGLYYNVYSRYYRKIKAYDQAMAYADSAYNLLAKVSDNGGLNYGIEQASIMAEAGKTDEAIPLFQHLLAKKDSFYRELSDSQVNELNEMHNIDNLLLEKEQHKALIQTIGLILITIALLVLIPSTIRIYCMRKKLKEEEEEIREMSRIAEEANEVKSHFLANMSYNIRIPLNNVLGFSQLMTADPDSVDASQWKEYSEIIQSNSAELIKLVNDVLDLSRLEAGRTKWQLQEYDILPLCSDVLNMVRMQMGDKIQVDFRTEIESQLLQMDISRITQLILSTLIYESPCEEKRDVAFSLTRDAARELLVFHIVNSPLADPKLQTQSVEVRHSINRLTVAHFGGTYTLEPDAVDGPTLIYSFGYGEAAGRHTNLSQAASVS